MSDPLVLDVAAVRRLVEPALTLEFTDAEIAQAIEVAVAALGGTAPITAVGIYQGARYVGRILGERRPP